MANSLLEKNRQQPGPASTAASGSMAAGEPPGVHLLSSLIDPVVTEKRLSFESKPGVSIDFKLTRESYGLFARLQPVEFRRMISNLVNNAVEALGDKGAVDVDLSHETENIILTVSDNGKGIPPEILAKLGRRGETHGKAGGSGLGLFHARSTAESWGGRLDITSAPGKGTSVVIKLPKAAAPAYFVSELKLTPGLPVVVLDDDPGVHQIWRGRFESARTKEHNIEDHHFSEPAPLRAWVKENPGQAGKAVCLFDYELSGFKETGLSLAEELGLCARTILVTSRSEEPRIIAECGRLGVRMIPKSLSDFVPIKIGAPLPALAVLIDDSALVHMTWETAAEEAGIELKGFRNPADFLAVLETFPKTTPIYIDSELGGDVKGEDIAADLRQKGFTDLYLATGHPPERFARLPWLKVIGKESPWQGPA
ncbi:MAG: ATP-binding protein [Desulfobaccales bacterium]